MADIQWDFVTPEFAHTVITNPEDLPVFYEGVGNNKELAFDFETTGLHYMSEKAAGISVADASHSWYLHGDALTAAAPWVVDHMNDPSTLWAGHNIKFDLHFLKDNLASTPRKIFDTQIAMWMLDENDSLKLKDLANRELGYTEDLPSFKDLQKLGKAIHGKKKMKDVSIWEIPIEYLGPYAALDARLTYDLMQKLRPLLKQEGLFNYFNEEAMPFVQVLRNMERNGMKIDVAKAEKLKEKYSLKIEELMEQWDKKTDGVNPNSTDQLAELLFEKLGMKSNTRTPTGKLSTGKLVLQRLNRVDKTGTIPLLMEIRKYTKLVNTYLDAFINKLHNGMLHTNFNYPGTVTGRLSSSGDMNFQNIPNHGELAKEIRALIIAPEGYALIGADYSQVELRLLAHMSRDENMVRAFLWGEDIHQLTADLMGVPRYVGKQLNFTIIYGGGPKALADAIEKIGKPRPSLKQAKLWLAEYEKSYPSIKKFKRIVLREGSTNGHITTIGGRHRHAENLGHWDNYIRSRGERQLINTKIQGSAGDIINWAMNEFGYSTDPATPTLEQQYDAHMSLQVHDELLWWAPESAAEEFARIAKAGMEAVEQHFGISVPIVAEPAIGHNWSEVKN